jgi:hypothetical protein
VLVLDGAVRRSIAGPVVGLLEALEGREVAIVTDRPRSFRRTGRRAGRAAVDLVRVRSGADAGREGRWIASLGPRRFQHGVLLEAAQVRFAEGPAVVRSVISNGSRWDPSGQNSRHASRARPWRRVRRDRRRRRPSRRLEPTDEVVLVERRPTFVMGLRKNWALVGASTLAHGERPLAALRERGIDGSPGRSSDPPRRPRSRRRRPHDCRRRAGRRPRRRARPRSHPGFPRARDRRL